MSEEKVIYATGRRKTSAARVFLKPGSGKLTINGKDYGTYLKRPSSKATIEVPLELAALKGKLDIMVTVKGGGESGQAGAIRHGISRALTPVSYTHLTLPTICSV